MASDWIKDAKTRAAYEAYAEAQSFARRAASDFTYTPREVAEANAVANNAWEEYRRLDAAEWDAAEARVAGLR